MQLIQEYTKDNENNHMHRNSYRFRIIESEDIRESWRYNFAEEYDSMIIKKLPKGFRKTTYKKRETYE